MTSELFHYIVALISVSLAQTGFAAGDFRPGKRWLDQDGRHINAHGGCVVCHEGSYYWFGEDRTGMQSNGISCYRSDNLVDWSRVGLVFSSTQAADPATGRCTLERPKVALNRETGQWVMYSHWEDGNGYEQAMVCVAVSDTPDGIYRHVATFRPNGHDSRDQTLFVDDDGSAWHFGSTDMNTSINVSSLAYDWLSTSQPVSEAKILVGRSYEAPAVFKVGDVYHGLFSGCTGWTPNEGHTAWTREIMGYWSVGDNFAVDRDRETTYHSQSNFVFKVPGVYGAYIYMGDRWDSSDVGGGSEYVWLPLSMRSGVPVVRWRDSWSMEVFDEAGRYRRVAEPSDGLLAGLLGRESDRWMSHDGNGFYIDDDNVSTNMMFVFHATDDPYVWLLENPSTSQWLCGGMGILRLESDSSERGCLWRLVMQEGGCFRVECVDSLRSLAVAGGDTSAGARIFLSADHVGSGSEFGLYVDTESADLETPDIYSDVYLDWVDEWVRTQEKHKSSVGGISGNGGSSASIIGRHLCVFSDSASGAEVTVYSCEGSVLWREDFSVHPGYSNSIDLPENLTGVCLAEVRIGQTFHRLKFASL